MTEHVIIGRDAAFVEFTLKYNGDTETLEHATSEVKDSISGYDEEFTCSCGEPLNTFEDARAHAADHNKTLDEIE